jgi:hypothetical protein
VNACTSRCGYCGRCDDGLTAPAPRSERPLAPQCDQCGAFFFAFGITVQGLGTFCGATCRERFEAVKAERKAS